MEILWLVVAWVLLLYLIRLHREISFYKRIFNQHKDIYVPTLPEMLERSTPGRHIFYSVLEYFRFAGASTRQRLNALYNRKSEEAADLPIMIMHHGAEKELKF